MPDRCVALSGILIFAILFFMLPPDSLRITSNTAAQTSAVADTGLAGIDSLQSQALPVAVVGPPVEITYQGSQEEEVLPNFFFTEHPVDLSPKPRIKDPDSWILPLLLIGFFFLSVVYTIYHREVKQIFLGIFKRDGIRKMGEQESSMLWRSLLSLLLIFLIVSPVMMYQVSAYFGWTTAYLPYLSPYFQLMLIGAGLLGFKIIFIGALGSVFYVEEEASQYVTGIVVMNALLAAVLIPISLGIKLSPAPFKEYLVLGGLGIFALCYLYSIGNGLIAGLRTPGLSKFHLFLYFCTLEILPVFIITKTVRSLI